MNSSEEKIQDLELKTIVLLINSNQEVQSIHNVHTKETLDRIEISTNKTVDRVDVLERDKWKRAGATIAITLILSITISAITIYTFIDKL